MVENNAELTAKLRAIEGVVFGNSATSTSVDGKKGKAYEDTTVRLALRHPVGDFQEAARQVLGGITDQEPIVRDGGKTKHVDVTFFNQEGDRPFYRTTTVQIFPKPSAITRAIK